MSKLNYKDERNLNITYLLLCLVPVLISFFLSTDGSTTSVQFGEFTYYIDLPCMFKKFTGYFCPACKMTRTFTYMSSFDITRAWSMNRGGVFLYFFCIYEIFYRSLRLIKIKLNVQKLLTVIEIVFLSITLGVILFQFIYQFFAGPLP